MNFIVKKCAQRIYRYILRRLKIATSDKDFFMIYCGLIRSLVEYACPAFIGMSFIDASRLQAIQKRCLKIKGSFEAPDLASRRKSMALSMFYKLPNLDTFLKELFPDSLPSGRLSVPFCRTSLRRSSFIPYMTVLTFHRLIVIDTDHVFVLTLFSLVCVCSLPISLTFLDNVSLVHFQFPVYTTFVPLVLISILTSQIYTFLSLSLQFNQSGIYLKVEA